MRERDLPAQGTQKNVAPAMPQAENDRRGEANSGIARQESNRSRRAAHDEQGRQKRELSPDQIANPAEYQRAEGADGKADGKSCQSL